MDIRARLDAARQARPDQPKQPPSPPPPTDDDDKYLRGMRWLYDDETDYKRARKKLAAEIARERLKKQMAQKARVAKFKQITSRLVSIAKAILLAAAKKAAKTTRRILNNPAHRKKALITLAGIAVVVLVITLIPNSSGKASSKKPTTSKVTGGTSATPEFDTVAPEGDVKQTASGKIAYDKQRKVASYTDTIDGIAITVSQQPLPPRFQKDQSGELAKFAAEINAKDKLQVGETTAYLGMSFKGPQTVILIKDQLLLFITAEKKLVNQALINYIDSLK